MKYYSSLYDNLPDSLSIEELNRLFQQFQQGSKDAKNKIILHNLKWVLYIGSKHFASQTDYEEYDDWFSIGTFGLIRAVETFNPSKNILFTTYASRCIFNEILMQMRRNKKLKQLVSLQTVLATDSYGNEIHLEDKITDEFDFLDFYLEQEEIQELSQYFSILNQKERAILEMYLGWGVPRQDQNAIANFYGISQSYVSRLLKSSIDKLRAMYFKNHGMKRKKSQN